MTNQQQWIKQGQATRPLHPHLAYNPRLDVPGRQIIPTPLHFTIKRNIDLAEKTAFSSPFAFIIGPTLTLCACTQNNLFDIDGLCMQIFGTLQMVYAWYLDLSLTERNSCAYFSNNRSPTCLFVPISYLSDFFIPLLRCPSLRYELSSLQTRLRALTSYRSWLLVNELKKPLPLRAYNITPDFNHPPRYRLEDWSHTRFEAMLNKHYKLLVRPDQFANAVCLELTIIVHVPPLKQSI